MIMSPMAPPVYSPLWTSPPGWCSANVNRATVITSSSPSYATSTRAFHQPTMPTSSSITMPPTNIPIFPPAWHNGRAITCTTRQLIPPGSIRRNAGLVSSPSAPFAVVRSPASAISCKKSMPSSSATSFQSRLRLDGYGRFDPAEDSATLFANFRDTTVEYLSGQR